jgi:hypothetical protein
MQVVWDDTEKTIIFHDYIGKWEWDEYFAAMKQVGDLMQEVHHPVDLIANMKNGTMPIKGAAFTFARKALSSLPANWGIAVIVINPFIAKMASVFKQFDKQLGSKLYLVGSVEEARTFIAKHRAGTR